MTHGSALHTHIHTWSCFNGSPADRRFLDLTRLTTACAMIHGTLGQLLRVRACVLGRANQTSATPTKHSTPTRESGPDSALPGSSIFSFTMPAGAGSWHRSAAVGSARVWKAQACSPLEADVLTLVRQRVISTQQARMTFARFGFSPCFASSLLRAYTDKKTNFAASSQKPAVSMDEVK